jgi:hypothetical protein
MVQQQIDVSQLSDALAAVIRARASVPVAPAAAVGAQVPLPQGDCRATSSDDPLLSPGADVMATDDEIADRARTAQHPGAAPRVANTGAMDGHVPLEKRMPNKKKSEAKSRSLPAQQSIVPATEIDVVVLDVSGPAHLIGSRCAHIIAACTLEEMPSKVAQFDRQTRCEAAEFVKKLRARCGNARLIGVLDGAYLCCSVMCVSHRL